MDLFIVRHGIAQERDAPGVRRDADRTLTDEGRRRTAIAARGLRALGCAPDVIGTSPLPRAEETARIMAEVLSPDVVVEVCDFLAPGGDINDLVTWLRAADAESAMIVGHMPDVAETVVALLTKRGDVDVQFKKAGTCCLRFGGTPARGQACLMWLIQPKQLRALAEM